MKRAVVLLAFVLAAAGPSSRARAVGRDEWQAAARLGIGVVHVDGRSPWGEAAGLDLEYGIADAWALRLSAEGSMHGVDKATKPALPGGTVTTEALLAGICYTIDVLRLVPYAELEFGVARIGGAVQVPQSMFVSELGLGSDYYLNPRWRVGVSLQYLYRPQDLLSNPQGLGNAPFTFSATARLAFGF
ncbi:MAG TPA: hypothetical protein VLT58_06375 [Polyangia bacterium]|nr:hypothetical protein [Polyangia bacterium]